MQPPASTDSDLLAEWLGQGREAAFRELVSRHAGLVHRAAWRTSGDESIATEASQLTFILLARKARGLSTRPSLAGWLHLTAVMQAKNLARRDRREARKRQHFQYALEREPAAPGDDPWKQMRPVLDEAIASLPEKDREALLLRFHRAMSIGETAATLGIATEAARKRIDRATERLRVKLARRGCHAGGSLAAVLLGGFARESQAATGTAPLWSSQALAAGTGTSALLAAGGATFLPILSMKAISLLPPAVILLVAGFWIIGKWQALAGTEESNRLLRQRIFEARLPGSPTFPITALRTESGGRIDWENLASQVGDAAFPKGESRAVRNFRERWQTLGKEEMQASLLEIDTLRLPQATLEKLGKLLMPGMLRVDPAMALDWFMDHLSKGELAKKHAVDFRKWAETDPVAASAWLDRQIGTGKLESRSLDGKSEIRQDLESGLLRKLIMEDPAAAERRILAMPVEQRADALQSLALSGMDGNRTASARLIQSHLPLADQARLLSAPVAGMARQFGYQKVDGYLAEIEASPGVRVAAASEAAQAILNNLTETQEVTRADMDTMRTWVRTQAPDQVDAITGEILSKIAAVNYGGPARGSKTTFAAAAALATRYHAESGSDELLVNFLTTFAAVQNKELARSLAEKISDPELRAKALRGNR